ncbi:MAG: MaoC family dehydratase [Betaproteobacteria bacterium]|jgi:acyl dehydratase|nr:MaoC family dehydratase [Betaproteobacteria bacterium]MBT6411160.1 MaoC family dehydratase [Betaproteobacteria bacterium]MCH1424078.1 MaoC family dehydratase [Burkholderiales bacterium]HAT52703.1 dehydratase [Betaproteobacteria bacterium]HAU83713.1 dehydratase [Betaproteobacteria bacterium]
MKKFAVAKPAELKNYVGDDLALSDWVCVTQDMIDLFAQSTGDHQWIHVDVERASRDTPFKSTIAHGFLTLSLLSKFLNDTIDLGVSKMGINYGLNRVRFTAPVKSGSMVRARFNLKQVVSIDDGVQLEWEVTVEAQNEVKPVLVAEWLTRRYG